MNSGKLHNEGGFSLLELLLVVGVGALLLLAGIATYRLVTQGTSSNEAVRVMTTIKEKTQRAFQGQRGYGANGANLVPTLVTMNAFPAGVLGTDNLPRHPWGGLIQITGRVQNFRIVFVGVPSDACISLGTIFDSDDTDFVSLSVGGTNFVPGGREINATNLNAPCSTAANVDMTWTFF